MRLRRRPYLRRGSALAIFLSRLIARAVLRQADEAGRLPAGVVVRVRAHMLWRVGTSKESKFSESWEVTSDEVHQIVLGRSDRDEIDRRREKSLPLNGVQQEDQVK